MCMYHVYVYVSSVCVYVHICVYVWYTHGVDVCVYVWR